MSGHISPINAHGIKTLSLNSPEHNKTVAREAEEVTAYKCPGCGSLHEEEFDAEECCPLSNSELAKAPVCPVCAEKYETFRNAADCCLWKDIDAITRWAIADAVEAGSTWKQQLGLDEFGHKETKQ